MRKEVEWCTIGACTDVRAERDSLKLSLAEAEDDLRDERNDTIQDEQYIRALLSQITELTQRARAAEQNVADLFDKSQALKGALMNCRIERDDPDTVMMLANEALIKDPFKVYGS